MYATMIILLLAALFIVEACSAQCEGLGKNECCSGYQWNETFGICSKCKPGYFGLGCRSHCNPPSYGEGCQLTCTQCSLEDCDISWGCPQIITTHTHTTTATTENVRETTKHFQTTTQSVKSVISITTSNSSSRTTEDNQIIGTSEKPSVSIVTTKNLLILGIFGVSLILFTLLIVFSCKAIYRRCSSRQNSNNKRRQIVKSLIDEEPVQYEEISDVRLLSNIQAKYSPLRPYATIEENKNSVKSTSSSEETSVLSSREDPEGKYITCVSDSVENNSYTDTGLLDPSNIHIPILDSTVTDAEGYEIPRSPVTKSRTITEEACAMKSTENSEKNDEYLTVVSDGFERG